MTTRLETSLEELAGRGQVRGAEAVVTAAFTVAGQPAPRTRASGKRVLAVALVAVVGLVGAATGYVRWRLAAIDRVTLAAVSAPADVRATTFLVVGSDSRAALTREETRRFGSADEVAGARADTLMLVRVDPDRGSVSLLSVPRDLLVRTDDGNRQRINGLLEQGPAALVAMLSRELQVEIDHYVAIEFRGFRRLVDALDGVAVPFAHAARDRVAGLVVAKPGCVRLGGDDALALVRSRTFEQLVGGRWQPDPSGDLGRIARQQAFVRAVLADVAASARTDPVLVNRLLRVAAEDVTVDDRLSLQALVGLGRRMSGSGADSLESYVLPITVAEVGGASVLELQRPASDSVVAAFLGRGADAVSSPGSDLPGDPPQENAAPGDHCRNS